VAHEPMAARYSPHEVEERLMEEWLAGSRFRAPVDTARQAYSIVIPPPNVTGSLHMGHALNSTIQDALTRYHRMQGLNALWLVGTDHAGIATQNKVEAALKEQGLTKEDLGRASFEERVWDWRRTYGSTIIKQLKRLGCSCDYENERFTMDEAYQRAVAKVFVELFRRGDIYRDVYLVNWCVRCGSAISDLEVEHVNRNDKLYYVRYPIVGEDDCLTVATTRPETILGDTGVAVNPKDPRYGRFVGRRARVPLTDRDVPIIADEHVDIEFGTGALKVTPAHDPDDWEIGRRHDLEAISVISLDGLMSEEAGPVFAGMELEAARGAVVQALSEEGLFVKEEDYSHSVGTCYRCGTIIEPLLSLQWFMNMSRLAKPAIACVEDGRVRFVPERWADVYVEWMKGIRPWCVSRQLWWGHRLPVYYCDACGDYTVSEDAVESCPKCGEPVHQEEDVLDTWFSSALWPFATLGWPDQTPELEYFYPTSVLSTARDIIYLWVARMIMMGLEFAGDVPFREVIIHPTILASDGRRMSKSLGTGVDPLELIEEYGADATRFGLLYMSSLQDVRFSNERVEMGRNFANKMWNASRLVIQGAHPEARPEVTRKRTVDRWIMSRLAAVAAEVTALYEAYDFAEATRVLYRFVWNEMCDWYLEIAKGRLYGEDEEEALAVSGNLLFLVREVMRLLHPMMPFVTEEVCRYLPADPPAEACSLLESSWPVLPAEWRDETAERAVAVFTSVIGGLRSARDELEVPRDRPGSVYLVVGDSSLAQAVSEEEASFRALAGCTVAGVLDAAGEVPEGRYTIVEGEGGRALLDLSGLVDTEKEKARLLAKAAKARKSLEKSRGKLANPAFAAKARPEVVAEEERRAEEAESLLAEIAHRYAERVGEELPT